MSIRGETDESRGGERRDERGPVPGKRAPAAVRPPEHWGLKWFMKKVRGEIRRRKKNERGEESVLKTWEKTTTGAA